MGDEGSAFDIGRRAVAAVARMRDTASPVSLLAEKIVMAFELTDWDVLITKIAEKPDDVFPRVFPLVVEAAEGGDNTAREILYASAAALANIASTVIRRLGLQEIEFILSKTGGVFGQSRLLEAMLDSVLLSTAPRAKIALLKVSPAVGAARLAQRLAESRGSGGHGTQG